MKLSCVCHAMKPFVGSESLFETLLLGGGEWSATWPKERVLGTHWMEG